MRQTSNRAARSKSSSLGSLETVLKDAKVSSSPEIRTYRAEVDEQQLVSRLIENVKKGHKWVSPFTSCMGHLFPDEYKEMVAADVR
jgi:hypothetical protein